MYDFLINNYVNNKLSLEDIYKFANKNGVNINENDAKVIFYYIKNYWQVFYKGNPDNLFMEIKNKISPDVYNKCVELYYEYKKMIN